MAITEEERREKIAQWVAGEMKSIYVEKWARPPIDLEDMDSWKIDPAWKTGLKGTFYQATPIGYFAQEVGSRIQWWAIGVIPEEIVDCFYERPKPSKKKLKKPPGPKRRRRSST